MSSETGGMTDCHVGRAANGQDTRRSECVERSLRELGFEIELLRPSKLDTMDLSSHQSYGPQVEGYP